MLTDPHGTSPLTKSIIGCAIRVHRVIGPVLTPLKLTALPVGLLINFNVPLLVDGVKRIVNPSLQSRMAENL